MEKQERIAKVLAEKSIYREGSLSFSCPKIELFLKAGEEAEGSFTVTGEKDLPLCGAVMTGDMHMRCLTGEFTGNPAKILFRFQSMGLTQGDTVRGEFKVISNQGEYTLPYCATIAPELFETSLGQIKNMFHFANLARVSWQEAVKIFYSPAFEEILTGNDRQYVNLYRALCTPPQREQRVEEFLICIRKKQKVTYTLEQENLELSLSEDIIRESAVLTRSGWGYTRLWVEVTGDFIETEKSVLTDDDFLGNQCECPVLLFRDRLHAGLNYGKVRFYNEYVSLEYSVCANHSGKTLSRRSRDDKKKTLEFLQYYLQYSMGKISRQEWLMRTETVVNGMDTSGGGNPLRELFKAHIMLTKERYTEVKWRLGHALELMSGRVTRPEIRCYYLYLMSLASGDEEYARSAAGEIRRVYQANQTNWQVAWLLLYLDEEYTGSLSRKWIFLEQQFEKGCRSPIWYLESAVLARKNPAFLMKFTDFAVQTLNFMAKYDFLTDECIVQIRHLAGRCKTWSAIMYRLLLGCYEKKKDKETLQAICSLLIKGGKTGPAYAPLYREGIERELWLTKLYEYYILSVDMNGREEVPAAALRYFSYSSRLPYDRMAYVYAWVCRKYREYPEVYSACLPDMEKFLIEQLEKRRMNRDIACLYRRLIQEGIMTEEMICKYAEGLFISEVRVLTPVIRAVIVVHEKLRGECRCPVNGGIAYVPVYDKDYSLAFEDGDGNRFAYEIAYEKKVISYSEDMLLAVLPKEAGFMTDATGVLLYQCEHGRTYTVVDERNVKYAARLWNHRELRGSYRNKLGMKLLHFYFSNDMTEELDAFLPTLRPEKMSDRERTEAMEILIFRGMYDMAYEWLSIYGTESMTAKMIMRLCSRILPLYDYTESDGMTALTYLAFQRGKYNETILYYLERYFNGTIREMREIWCACDRFDLSSYELSERMLLQMLFTGEYVQEETEIFRRYLEGSSDEMLVGGCLSHFAGRYFMYGQSPEPFVWNELKRKNRNGERQNEICELALLAYLSEKEELDGEEEQIVREFVDDLVLTKGIVFGFFRKFAGILPGTAYYENLTFLEYRTESKDPLTLHYMLKSDAGGSSYRTEEMKSCYAGIYTRGFPLFIGEELQYYITQKTGDGEVLVDSGELRRDEGEGRAGAGRFAVINDFLAAASGEDKERAERVMEDYYRTDFLVGELFTLS